ncbi:hypothetical protein Tco_0998147 [Tanacetum coccineum]
MKCVNTALHNCFDAQPVAAVDTSPSDDEPGQTNTFYSYQARRASEDRHHQDSTRTTRSHPEASRRRHPAAANGYDVKVLVDTSDVDRVYEVQKGGW